MKERPILFSTEMVQAILDGRKSQTRRVYKKADPSIDLYAIQKHSKDYILSQCPYGWPGDQLWVRETHMYVGKPLVEYIYKAGYPDNIHPAVENLPEISGIDWKPSIFMPKEAARIWLEITEVRVEQLKDISGKDAKAEGVHTAANLSKLPSEVMAIAEFKKLWISINGAGSWENNPWVWVVSFRVLSTSRRPD